MVALRRVEAAAGWGGPYFPNLCARHRSRTSNQRHGTSAAFFATRRHGFRNSSHVLIMRPRRLACDDACECNVPEPGHLGAAALRRCGAAALRLGLQRVRRFLTDAVVFGLGVLPRSRTTARKRWKTAATQAIRGAFRRRGRRVPDRCRSTSRRARERRLADVAQREPAGFDPRWSPARAI